MENNRATTSNYLTIELSQPREARQMVEVCVGQITETGLKEHSPFSVLNCKA